jgi:hypothetical protein
MNRPVTQVAAARPRGGSPRMDKRPSRPFAPSEQAVRSLIRRASRHSLGRDFLLNGALDAVAATFSVHAFTVEKARDVLGDDGKGRAAATPSAAAQPATNARAKAKGA